MMDTFNLKQSCFHWETGAENGEKWLGMEYHTIEILLFELLYDESV